MTTLLISLPAIVNVGALLLLFFFIYAYMGKASALYGRNHLTSSETFAEIYVFLLPHVPCLCACGHYIGDQ